MRIVKAVLVFIIICIVAGIGFLYLAPEKATKLAIDMERKRSGLERKEIIFRGISITFIWKAEKANRLSCCTDSAPIRIILHE